MMMWQGNTSDIQYAYPGHVTLSGGVARSLVSVFHSEHNSNELTTMMKFWIETLTSGVSHQYWVIFMSAECKISAIKSVTANS